MDDIEIAEKHKMIGRNVAMCRKIKGLSQLELSLSLGHKSIVQLLFSLVSPSGEWWREKKSRKKPSRYIKKGSIILI